ncbi:signal peptidase II [Marinicaulis aureus]|uniref:Lipoprotein signal peptidase n=1 Tax=Hyphococcus aureus TaxID=2666033 RepID=A0ABW1KZT5_9PROT
MISPGLKEPSVIRRVGLSCAALVLVVDIVTKRMAEGLSPDALPIAITPFLNVVLVGNRGVSFGLLTSDNKFAPFVLAGLAILIIAFVLRQLWKVQSRTEASALGLIIGGAIANAIDRIGDGTVTDFIDLYVGGYHWPSFNFADAAITGGVLIWVLFSRATGLVRQTKASN